MLNQCIFEGRLVADPELKKTTSGMSICDIKIAVDRTIKKEGKPALFLPVTFFGATADNASKFLRKGRAVIAIGRLENDEYVDREGNKKTIFYLNGSTFELPLTEKQTEKQPQLPTQAQPQPQGYGNPGTVEQNTYANTPNGPIVGGGLTDLDVVDDDLPF